MTRATSPERLALWTETQREAVEKAGADFDWLIMDNSDLNRGQHLPFNEALTNADVGGYDFLLRIDEDVSFLTQRWLAKMLDAASKLGPNFIISPTIKGLKFPPAMSQVVEPNGVPCRFLDQAVGGACRLHPVKLLLEGEYVSDVRWPMGAGDATGLMLWAKSQTAQGNPVWCVWLDHVRVHHGTATQEREDPRHFDLHTTLQKVPFIPRFPLDYPEVEPAVPLQGGNFEAPPEGYVEAQRGFNWRHRDGAFEHADEAKWTLATFKDLPDDVGSILDVGCRGGASLVAWQARWPSSRVVGVDVVAEFIIEARKKGLDAREADMHQLPFQDGEFEWVVCNGTMEHAYNVAKVAREFGRVASQGVWVTCDLRTKPLGSDFAYSPDPATWRALMLESGMEVKEERVEGSGVTFVLVRS